MSHLQTEAIQKSPCVIDIADVIALDCKSSAGSEKEKLSDDEMTKVINALAKNGITLLSNSKLEQDRSVHLYPDGSFYDFGKNNCYYISVEQFIEERPDLINAPVQAKKSVPSKNTGIHWNIDDLTGKHRRYRTDIKEFYELEEATLLRLMDEFLPRGWFADIIPDVLGYRATKPKTLTVSALDGDGKAQAVCFRRDRTKNGTEIKWKTFGSKKFIPSKITGKDKVYLASGMGELIMLEILGVDYICLQSDGMAKHLTEPATAIYHLIILPDNDDAFMSKIPIVLERLNPHKASIVKWSYLDPRDAAFVFDTPKKFLQAIEENLEDLLFTNETVVDIQPLDFCNTPIAVQNYVETMKNHWVKNLDQTIAKGMEYNWSMFADTMNRVINENMKGSAVTAYIIGMATGESKTQGSVVFTAILNRTTEHRVMIVVNLNDDAFLMADQINSLGGDAVAYNSDAKNDNNEQLSPIEASEHKTIIISHETFKQHGHRGSSKWEILSNNRDLIIVDEALHDVEVAVVDEYSLDLLRPVAQMLKDKHMLMMINGFRDVIRNDLMNETKTGHLQVKPLRNEAVIPMKLFREVLGKEKAMLISDPKVKTQEIIKSNVETIEAFIASIDNLPNPRENAIICKARRIKQTSLEYFYREQTKREARKLITIWVSGVFGTKSQGSLTALRELLPGAISFAVMDATSSVNAIYRLQSTYRKNVRMVPVQRTRNYENFKIHTIKTVTGAGSISGEEIHALLHSVPMVGGDKVFIVTHKKLEPFAESWVENQTLNDVTFDVEHFGNLTGKNDWRDFNKIVVIGLPHKNSQYYQALNIIKTDEQIAYGKKGKHNLTLIENTDLSADLVQAIARIRIRNVNDENGGCLPAEAWITVNSKKDKFDSIITALKSQFSGAKITDWHVDDVERIQAKLPKGFESTLSYLESQFTESGMEMEFYEPRDALGIQRDTYLALFKNKEFKDRLHALGVDLQERTAFTSRGKPKKRPIKVFVKMRER